MVIPNFDNDSDSRRAEELVASRRIIMEKHLEHRDRVGVADAVLLEDYTSEQAFVDNLEKRFRENLIYTYIGPVLVSVNPYKNVDIYGPDYIAQYENKHFFEVPPHVFAITDNAYRSLIEEHNEQCVLISGESGSGKTEASKKVLQYIAAITEQRGTVEQVKDKLLQSNPLLEAFGNAKTNRNDNSSRFGKYMDVQFDYQGLPVGGNILIYLLEKSRVLNQAVGERNFHIFYQLLAGAQDEELTRLGLVRQHKSYVYLNEHDGSGEIDDAHGYRELEKALKTLEFKNNEKDDLLSIVASVLHLGNVKITEEDARAKISERKALEEVCRLVGANPNQMIRALTHRTITAHGDVVTSPLNKEFAVKARDALAKATYDRLFTWLVHRLNRSLQPEDGHKHIAMGILDIYGFEIFERNSFEQLCINFCNEKLQQLFIELTLKSEQEEYLKEGIEWQNIEYFDNKVICDLIEEKHKGIIALMDEECLRPGEPTDASLLTKMNVNFRAHKHYINHEKADVKTQKTFGRDEFRLVHYAGDVTYNVSGFLEKNNDLLFRDLKETMSDSSNDIVKLLFPVKEQESMKRPETAITQFKTSLNNLIDILMDKEPSYIRCVKPNEHKTPSHFDETLVKHQVKYLGLMENLRVRRAGFAYRRTYERFLERYKSLCKATWPKWHGDPREGVQVLIDSLDYQPDEYRMGKTKIFVRYPKTLFRTEDAFQLKKHDLASKIQAAYKGLLQRRKFLHLKSSAIVVQKYMRRHLAKKEAQRRRHAARLITRFVKGFLTRDGPVTEINSSFVELAKRQWLVRLSKSLPTNILKRTWPGCPHSCQQASALLERYYGAHLSRVYRLKLSSERKAQLELKILAETLFKNKKKSYAQSVPALFQSSRISREQQSIIEDFLMGGNAISAGEKQKYVTSVMKYDRHGYKPRERVLLVTDRALYLLELTKSVKLKHRIPVDSVDLVVTSEKDSVLMVRLPDDLLQREKGDLILEVSHLIEALTKIVDMTKKPQMLTIINQKTIEHHMKQGKQGVIEITTGNPQSIHKSKSGNLLIVASP